MRTFLQRHDRVLVLEEKRAVIAPALRALAQEENLAAAIDSFGTSDNAAQPAFGLTSAAIASALSSWVRQAPMQRPTVSLAATARETRPPQYCGGCPHQVSTHMPEQHRAYAGVGCHYIGATQDWAHYLPLSQMGGEGAAWLGARHFAGRQHVFANMGDGTYSHSGLLSIRAAVAAGANMTFQILFNRTVAMTGGQAVETGSDLAQLIDQLLAEGVAHVAAVGPSIATPGSKRANVSIHGREVLAEVRDRLAATVGVTALVYDQECATESRRKIKRGLAPAKTEHAFIATEVCEGCGDCVTASGCSAIGDHATELGVKKQVHAGNCNDDLSCLNGQCPSFLKVSGQRRAARRPVPAAITLAELAPAAVAAEMNLVIAGIGGSGVVTLAAALARAAYSEGAYVHGVNLTGMAQKGGAVVSQVRVAQDARASCSIPAARASVVLALDPACAASQDVLALLGPASIVFCAREVEGTMRQSLHLAGGFDREQMLERVRGQGATVVPFPARALARRYSAGARRCRRLRSRHSSRAANSRSATCLRFASDGFGCTTKRPLASTLLRRTSAPAHRSSPSPPCALPRR